MQRAAVRLLASIAAAGGLTLLVYALLPSGLDVRTDIVGYPTFADFDIDRYFWTYGLIVILFPLLGIGLYAAVTRLVIGRLGPWRPLPAPRDSIEELPPIAGWTTWAVAAGRALLVGCAGGLELAMILDRGWDVMLATGVLYAAGVLVAGRLVEQAGSGDRFAAAGMLNTLATPFLVAGLWGVSRSTEIEIAASGEVRSYPWLPSWIAFGVTAGLLVVFVLALRRRSGRASRQRVEQLAVLLVAAPVVLFLVLADLPADLGTFDSYEEGQAVAAAQLVRDGAFPWRDLMLTHGLLSDVVRGVLGFAVFDESRWGLVAGDDVLLIPLAGVALYYLCAYLFWTNWVFLLGTQLLVVTGLVTTVETRFLLVPFVFLLLAAFLSTPSVPRAAAFTAVLFVQVVVTPEALVVAVAALAALAAFEFSYGKRGEALAAQYRRVALCLAAGLGLTLAWALSLAAVGALDDWAFGLASVIPGHRLTGGIASTVPKTEFELLAPVVAVLVAYAFVAARVRLRRAFAYQDWVLVAMGLYALLYYTKFLSRADSFHLDQSFSAAVPLLFYLAFRGITYGEALLARHARSRGLDWFPRRHTLTIPVLVVLLAAVAPEPLSEVIDDTPRHFSATVSREPAVAGIGYARPGENDVAAIESLADAIERLVEPGETVFDFSNAPGLTHYLLGFEPSTRYYHVSFAIRGRTQRDLVQRLEREPAGAVVVATRRTFNDLPAWDGIANHVRHYDVSQHLLDEYVPMSAVGGFVVMAPRASGRAAVRELYFRADPCDWGYVPNFLDAAPDRGAESIRLRATRSDEGRGAVVTLPPAAADYRWLELRTGEPFAESRFELTDRRGGDSRRTIAFSALGRGERVLRVKVGSCSQWRGYTPGPVYLTSNVPQDLDEIRLLR